MQLILWYVCVFKEGDPASGRLPDKTAAAAPVNRGKRVGLFSLGQWFTLSVILFNHLITGWWFCLVPVSHFLDEKSTNISFPGFYVGCGGNVIDRWFIALKVNNFFKNNKLN
jgi:lipoprotein signal peptidase